MILDFRHAHLGDVLMALPAMREGDSVIVSDERHTISGAPVQWLREGKADTWPAMRRGRHATDAWLEATGRAPLRHRLLPAPTERQGIVIAPSVAAVEKRWPWDRWAALMAALPGSRLLDDKIPRAQWMRALDEAETVICPDTGTAHMADALGCDHLIVLHGLADNWPHCAPYWNRSHCIYRPGMAEITIKDVLEKVNG